MPTPGNTNLVVTDVAGDALRQRARVLSAELGRRVSLSEALERALADRPTRVKPRTLPTSESGVSASADGRR